MRTLGGLIAFLIWCGGSAVGRRRRQKTVPTPAEESRRRRLMRGALGLVSAVLVTLLGVFVTDVLDDDRSRQEETTADRRQLEELLTRPSLVGVDFRGYDLTEQSLVDRDMSDAHLDGVRLVRAELDGVVADGARMGRADLRSASVRSSSFAGADLAEARLTNTVLAEVALTEADLAGADVSGATAFDLDLGAGAAEGLRGSSVLVVDGSVRRANLVDADLAGSVLLGVDFTNAVLDRADLSGAQLLPRFDDTSRPLDPAGLSLTEADIATALGVSPTDLGRLLDEARLVVTDLADVRPSEFVRSLMLASLKLDISLHGLDTAEMMRITGFSADEFTVQPLFSGTSLREADLTDVDLLAQTVTTTDLTGATVQGADLAGATIARSSLAGVDVGGAQRVDGLVLTEVRAQSSVWSGRTYTGLRLTDVDLDYADLRETELVDSSFDGVSLRGADLRGADLSSVDAVDMVLAETCFDRATRLPPGVQLPAEAFCYERPPVPRRSTNEAAPESEAEPLGPVDCDGHTCFGLQVYDTFEGGRDEGLYVRSCFGAKAECPRPLALAALDDVMWAYCKVEDGLDVEGNTTWVRVTWNIVPNAVPADGRVNADDTGYSSPTAEGRGWATTRYLRDRETIDRLPLCDADERRS